MNGVSPGWIESLADLEWMSCPLNLATEKDVSALQDLTIDELVEEFEFLGTWEDQCRYLIELGGELPDLDDSEKTEANRVHGCQAPGLAGPGSLPKRFSDAHRSCQKRCQTGGRANRRFAGSHQRQIAGRNPGDGLPGTLLSSRTAVAFGAARRNGLFSMVARVRAIAESHLPDRTPQPSAPVARPAPRRRPTCRSRIPTTSGPPDRSTSTPSALSFPPCTRCWKETSRSPTLTPRRRHKSRNA